MFYFENLKLSKKRNLIGRKNNFNSCLMSFKELFVGFVENETL